MTKVAIVGGAGFIGTSVVAALAGAGDDVMVFDTARRLARAGALLSGAGVAETDQLSPAAVARELGAVEVLIHLAWSSQPDKSMTGMVDDARDNIVGGLDLLTAAAAAGVKKIIFASSGGTVYGNTDRLPITEGLPPNPVSAYGVSKAALERYLQLIAFHHKLTGVSLRVGNPYGPYQFAGTPIGVIANFIRRLRSGEPLTIFGDGEIVRDYIWIDDVGAAFAAAVHEDVASGEYNVGSGEGHSINQIADLVEKMLGAERRRDYRSYRSFDARAIVLDASKFRRATGWRPNVGLAEGVDRMAVQGAEAREGG